MKSDQKDAHDSAPATANPYLHQEDHQVAHPAHAHEDMPAVTPHPTAMMAYVDVDHDHAHAAHPAQPHLPPAVAKAIATAEAAIAHVGQVVHDEIAKEQKRHAVQEQTEKVTHSVNGVTAVMVASQLAGLSHDMNDEKSRAFIQTLDTLQDPDLRHQVMAQYQAQTGQKMEDFINGSSDWANNGKNRDKAAALALISPERDQADKDLAAMTPADRKAAQEKAAEDAKSLALETSGRDHSDENSQKIFKTLEKKTPAEMELLRAAMRDETSGKHNLYERIDYGMHKGDEDEAVAMLAGNHVQSAQAALKNEDDPKRLVQAVNNLDKADRDKMLADPATAKLLTGIKNPSDRAAVNAAMAGNPDLARGEMLGNDLMPKDEGMGTHVDADSPMVDKVGIDNYDRRKAKNVLKEFEGMSGEQVHAAVVAWDKAHPDRTMESMLEARWGGDSDKTEYNRIKAMMAGDKGLDRSLRFEEGVRENDKDEIEGALAHEKTDANDLKSKDKDVQKHALEVQKDNESFERHNIEADHTRREAVNLLTGRHDDTTGHSTADQITAHTKEEEAKDVKQSYQEVMLRADGQDKAADAVHEVDRQKHEKEARENGIAAQEMLADGKLSAETEFHRGKGAKEKAAALETISSNKKLAEAQKAYREKYGEEMLPDTKKDRSDMNANELMVDNVRLYGARGERPAQVEAMLEVQQYEVQKSSSLEYDEGGRGTQEYQRILMEKERAMLKDPKYAVHAPKFVDEIDGKKLPFPQMVEDPNEPSFNDIQVTIDKMQADAGGDIHKVDDGLKEGVKKTDFNAVDKQLVAANAEQEGAKKRLAEKFVRIFSTIAKIAAVLTANPWLIALIDVGEGLIEMGIKHEVMGEAYDATEDLKMLAITGAADIALLGFSKLGEMKGAAKLAEAEAVSVGEKAAMEVEHSVTAEAKSEAVRDGAHVAAGESSALRGAIEEGGSAEKALSREATAEVGAKVEQKATEVAEGKAVHEGESAAAKQAESELAQDTAKVGEEGAVDATKAAEKIRANYALAGGAAKMGIQTVGGGVVQGKSPSDMLKGLVTGGLGLVLPGHLAGKAKAAIGTETAAAKVLGEVASYSTEVMTNTTINAAGGAEGGDALFDAALGAGGARVQHLYPGAHGAAPVAEEEHAAVREETPVREESPVAPEHGSATSKLSEPIEIDGAHVSHDDGKAKALSTVANTSGDNESRPLGGRETDAKKLPPPTEKVDEAVKWANDKLEALPKDGHMSRERELELFEQGKITAEDHITHLAEFDGMDAFANSEAGKAAGLSAASSPDEIIAAAHLHLKKLNQANYDLVQSGQAQHPAGVTPERLKLAVEGGENGDRVPLTYKGEGGVNDLAGAAAQMNEFRAGIAEIAERNGITDMQVVQVGSGTTGWKNNPMKLLSHYGGGGDDQSWFQKGAWTSKSDTDLAVFSDQAKVGAMEVDNPINADYGIFKTGDPTNAARVGFSHTDLGGDLFEYGKVWDQRVYDPAVLAEPKNRDGLFDFKLNVKNDAFTSPPTVYTGPERDGAPPALGARGASSGRPYDPNNAGGPVRELSTDGVKVTAKGIDVVEQHLARFGGDNANQVMIERLRQISAGKLAPTPADMNFYTHELREFVRYRKLGFATGNPGHEVWNNAHSATLEDYGLREGPGVLYHPDAEQEMQ